VQDISDASILDYTHGLRRPVPVGGIVVVQHRPSRRYLALVIDAIHPVDPRSAGGRPFAYADVSWFLTSDGSANFSAAP